MEMRCITTQKRVVVCVHVRECVRERALVCFQKSDYLVYPIRQQLKHTLHVFLTRVI